MTLEQYSNLMLPAIENELRGIVNTPSKPGFEGLYQMLVYHMGWDDQEHITSQGGKRIRPLIVLLCTVAVGGDWRKSLPAAASVELIHNFSLIHDDIQDNSELRRGRKTVWKIWGIPQAINAGDSMFTLAQTSVLNLRKALPLETTIQVSNKLQEACLRLTEGQYLDMSYENKSEMDIESYWNMIEGKTASLLAAACEIGGLCGNAGQKNCNSLRDFGRYLGLAFQVHDDLLGIWGDSLVTGKSAESDLVMRKKTLPVVYGLEQNGEFARRWKQGRIRPEMVSHFVRMLENEGAKEYTKKRSDELTGLALEALKNVKPSREAGTALETLAHRLLVRED